MRPKIIAGLFALALPLGSMAQTLLHIQFESADPHQVWIADSPPTAEATDLTKSTVDLPVDSALKKPSVWVWNRKTGNMAVHLVGTLAGKWVIQDADYTEIGRMLVRVESKGQPVASAQVEVKGTGLDQQSLLSPGDKGDLSFFAVQSGTVTLTVKYKVQGKDADPIQQAFQLALKRDKPDPTLIVSIPDQVDVIPTAPPSPASTPAATPGPVAGTPAATPAPTVNDSPSPIRRIITLIIVLGIIGGLCYLIIVQMRKNSDLVQDKLRQLGVDIPHANPQTPIDAIAPTPLAPTPQQKIMLGDATPDPIAMPSAPVPPISMSTGVPTLRMANGDAFELPEGETIVGRDLGLGLSLVNESTVSRRHASVTRSGSDVRVRDLGSSNGTFVNGVKVVGEAPVRHGDSVQFGAVQTRFEG